MLFATTKINKHILGKYNHCHKRMQKLKPAKTNEDWLFAIDNFVFLPVILC